MLVRKVSNGLQGEGLRLFCNAAALGKLFGRAFHCITSLKIVVPDPASPSQEVRMSNHRSPEKGGGGQKQRWVRVGVCVTTGQKGKCASKNLLHGMDEAPALSAMKFLQHVSTVSIPPRLTPRSWETPRTMRYSKNNSTPSESMHTGQAVGMLSKALYSGQSMSLVLSSRMTWKSSKGTMKKSPQSKITFHFLFKNYGISPKFGFFFEIAWNNLEFGNFLEHFSFQIRLTNCREIFLLGGESWLPRRWPHSCLGGMFWTNHGNGRSQGQFIIM